MKTITGSPRIKALETWKRIQNGAFSEHDIDNILIALRNYSGHQKIFVEVADFVAHGDQRDRGPSKHSLRSMYLSMTYFVEYVSPKIALDISKPFPSYIKELMKCELDKCEDAELRRDFGVSTATVRKRVDKIFKDDKKLKLSCAKKPISSETIKILRHLLGAIRSQPAFSGDQFFDELIAVGKLNDLDVDEPKLRLQSNKIILCVLLLLHEKEYSYGGLKPGRSEITSEAGSIPIGPVQQPKEHIDWPRFGALAVNGIVSIISDQKSIDIAFPLMTTTLLAKDWCDESLFVEEDIADQLADDFEHFYSLRLDTSQALCINDEFKLSVYSAQKGSTSAPNSQQLTRILFLGSICLLVIFAVFLGVRTLGNGT
jgi:hypothetical protein